MTKIFLSLIYYSFYLIFPLIVLLIWLTKKRTNKKITFEIIILLTISLFLIWARFIEPNLLIIKKYNFNLIEKNVSNVNEVNNALYSLIDEDIDALLTSGDNTVSLAIESIAKILKEHKIPFFTNTFSDVELGAFASIGADYYEVGVETAKVFERVLQGENPSNIPVKNYIPEKMYLNLSLANNYGIHIPSKILSKADKIMR